MRVHPSSEHRRTDDAVLTHEREDAAALAHRVVEMGVGRIVSVNVTREERALEPSHSARDCRGRHVSGGGARNAWSMGFEYYWKTETVVRQNSVRRDLHRFGLQLTTRSGRARNGLVALARDRLGLPRISGSRPRKHCPAAPAANVATDGQAATPPHPRPDVLGR